MKPTKKLEAELHNDYEAENLQLRDTVKRQALELEQKKHELEIEAALERVRSRTMSMQKSDELSDVVIELFNQLSPMGLAKSGFTLYLVDKTEQGFDIWFSIAGGKVLKSYNVPRLDHPVFEKLWSAYIQQVPIFDFELKGEEKISWDTALFEKTDFRKLP